MAATQSTVCIAFDGAKLIAEGELMYVAAKTRRMMDRGSDAAVLIFNAATSEPVDVDFRGTVDDVLGRIPAATETAEPEPETPRGLNQRGPGRPKLGVVAREVTLLPRHWEWLNRQRGGASVALRKLVDDARHAHEARTAPAPRRKPLTVSCPAWPVIARASRKLRAPYSRMTPRASTGSWRSGPRTSARTPINSLPHASNTSLKLRQRAEATNRSLLYKSVVIFSVCRRPVP